MRILFICEPSGEAKSLVAGLKKHNYAVDLARTPADAERMSSDQDYDAIVAKEGDSPLIDAVKITRRLRQTNVGEPVLVIPDQDDEEMVTDSFNAGADQVMDPEHSFNELLARIRGLLRQCDQTAGDTLVYRDIEMDLPRLHVTRDGKKLGLIGKPFAVLEYFLRGPEKVHSREDIGRAVWDQNFDPFSNVIDVTVSKVRQQLDKPFEVPYLHTIVGSGYMLSKDPPGQSEWG